VQCRRDAIEFEDSRVAVTGAINGMVSSIHREICCAQLLPLRKPLGRIKEGGENEGGAIVADEHDSMYNTTKVPQTHPRSAGLFGSLK
jgi:hypothetical protein